MASAAQVITLDLVFEYNSFSGHVVFLKDGKKNSMNPQDKTRALATPVVSIGLNRR